MPFSVSSSSSSSVRGLQASRQAAASKSAAVVVPPKRAQEHQVASKSFNAINNKRQQQFPAAGGGAASLAAAFFASVVVASGVAGPAAALGLESIAIPALDNAVAASTSSSSSSSSANAPLSGQAAKLADADAAFESSELLRTLKERTAANAEANRKAIADKYCLRQSELGVGDCAGLRLIPGATKSGKQKTPKLLAKLIGKEEAIDAYNNSEANDAAIAAVEKMRKNAAP